jgi:acetate kinase
MDGADAIIFTAGIGENNPQLRAQVCANLDFCGLELDAEANARARAQEAVISTSRSKIEVRIIPTNEELIIARNAWEKLSSLNTQTHTEN